MSDAGVAPSLSTHQDDSTFSFQKYEHKQHTRTYLGDLINVNDQSELFSKIRDFYSINELIELLSEEDHDGDIKYKKITLQFPDLLVADSAIVVQLLQEGLIESKKNHNTKSKSHHDNHDDQDHSHSNEKHKKDDHECKKTCLNCKCDDPLNPKSKDNTQHVWILADTAYSACCIDEVAAEHVLSDIVVHFGDACMNAIQKLPAAYVFGKPYLDLEKVISKFKSTYTDTNSKVVLMADASYTCHLESLFNSLRTDYKEIAFADVNTEKANNAKIIGFQSSKLKKTQNTHIELSNRTIISEAGIDEDSLVDYSLFHITTPQPPHLLFLSTKFNEITLYDPITGEIDQGPFPSLMRRYRYMHMARTAGTIGILVNTLSLRNTTDIIKKVSTMIREADKKSYMFVVGKPNVAKLANFESIDIWCILGCGQGGIVIDTTSEFFKPIITPYELELSLNPMVQWSGKWVVDFEDILNEQKNLDEEETGQSSTDETNSPTLDGEDDTPIFNPVTGQFVSTSRPLRNIQHLEIDSVSENSKEEGKLVKAFSNAVSIKGTVSTSAIHLQNREWTGLGSDYQYDEDFDKDGAIVEEGTSGIARGYGFDMEGK